MDYYKESECIIIKAIYSLFFFNFKDLFCIITLKKQGQMISSSCIHCGKQSKQLQIKLLHNNCIHVDCFHQIENIIKNNQDQIVKQFYHYIRSLIVECTKCKKLIDGILTYIGREDNEMILCNICCQSEEKFQEEFLVCLLCEQKKHIKDINLQNALNVCNQCHEEQKKNEVSMQKQKKFNLVLTNFKNKIFKNKEKRYEKGKYPIESIESQKKQYNNAQIQGNIQKPGKKIYEKDYKLKQCKICMNRQSKMMNMKCRHLMMCQQCFQSYKLKYPGEQLLPCPVCKTIGPYHMYVEPIYI